MPDTKWKTALLVVALFHTTSAFNFSTVDYATCCPKLSPATELCNANIYRYLYCTLPSTCVVNTTLCSDNSQQIFGFSRPLYHIQEQHADFYWHWGLGVTLSGLVLIFMQRNNQPMRTRNIYIHIFEVVAQMLFVRVMMAQSESDPCILTQSINIVTPVKITTLAQLYIFKKKIQREKKLEKSIESGTLSTAPISNDHWLDTLSGAILLFCGIFGLGLTCIYMFTDIPLESSACNMYRGYPGVSQLGVTITLITITALVVYTIQNYHVTTVSYFKFEVWLVAFNALFMIFFLLLLRGVQKVMLRDGNKFLEELLEENGIFTALMLSITIFIFVRCFLPMMYHLNFKYESIVTDKIRELFIIAEKQPFAMKKLTEYAGTELETESVLLYYAVRTLLEHRTSVKDSFVQSESVAKVIVDHYICGSRKTLDYYGLRSIVRDIKTPVELIEKEKTVLVELEAQIRERIMLPMFARWSKNNSTKAYDT